ncbi:TPA: hypothetical protein ACH3X2_002662 [Trebouxia sp. C0005]
MPEDMLCPQQHLESLTAAIYGDLQQHHADSQYLSEQAILTLKNLDGDAINDMILQSFSQEACHLTSSDSRMDAAWRTTLYVPSIICHDCQLIIIITPAMSATATATATAASRLVTRTAATAAATTNNTYWHSEGSLELYLGLRYTKWLPPATDLYALCLSSWPAALLPV